ncbi:hypothetical protein [Streptomyces sp. NPDC002328]|uniref:hypothetical protein n=1 Tax=Streptomyces sp. NPDC002328 TaxID=3364642 RepID=UPI0036960D83
MTLTWTPTTLALVDDDYDRVNASDGRSRFGAYLAQHPRDFEAWAPEALNPSEFAAAAWRIATSPVMSPGYVRTRPDLAGITTGFAEDGPDLVLTVRVPVLHSDLHVRLPYEWRDWQSRNYRHDGSFPEREAPDDRHPAVLATAEVRVPIDEALLPAPKHLRGPGLLADAREAVFTLAELVNDKAGPVVARLRDLQPARARQR